MIRRAVIVASWVLIAATASAQDYGWYTVSVPGGRATLRTLGIDDDRDRAGAMIEVIRRLHFSTQDQVALQAALRKIPIAMGATVTVPLPLAPATWQKVIFKRPVPASRLFAEILNDAAARLLYHGLYALDADTRAWIETQSDLLRHLYRDQTALQSFALFAPAIHVRDGRIVVPGGDLATQQWASIIGNVGDPARFISKLFFDRDGRVAGLYFLSAYVESNRRQFLLTGRFSTLVASFADCYPRQSNDYPFVMRSKDPAWLLLAIGVNADGALTGPRTRGFWHDVFDGDGPATMTRDDTPIDAAWLVDRLCNASTTDRASVFETLLAGQRVFGGITAGDMRPAMLALRVRRQRPALFIALERAGFRTPVALAAIGHAAPGLDRLSDMTSAPIVLQQFQGALAVVIGARASGALSSSEAEQLMLLLGEVPIRSGRYDGRMAAWFERQLLPSLRAALKLPGAMTAEELIARGLAGEVERSPLRVEWEGSSYVVDYPSTVRDRLLRVRQKQGGATIDQALSLIKDANTPAAIQAGDAALGQALASWAYAPHVGDANSAMLIGGDASLRHDLGIRAVNSTRFEQRWEIAMMPGVRGAIAGSYLGLDSALAIWSLRRIASDRIPSPPTLGENDRVPLVSLAVLLDARRLQDDDMHGIASAIADGTQRIAAASADARQLQQLATDAAISPWRVAALPWMAGNEPEQVDQVFSTPARARLGGLKNVQNDAWGTSAIPIGCLCLQPPPAYIPEVIVGRPVDGIVGAYSADLTFRVAELLTELKLPAQLIPAVMAYAMRDYIDGIRPLHPADVEAFSRQARRLGRTIVEDYVGAIAAVGPLQPALNQ